MALIRVLSPIGPASRQTLAAPPLPAELGGRVVGFLDNTKANFDRLVAEIAALLTAQWGVRAVVHRRKANAASPAAPELLAELAKQCDVVFAGSAD